MRYVLDSVLSDISRTTMYHIHLFFQTRMLDESHLAPHPRL